MSFGFLLLLFVFVVVGCLFTVVWFRPVVIYFRGFAFGCVFWNLLACSCLVVGLLFLFGFDW